jgi:hypothetical protein
LFWNNDYSNLTVKSLKVPNNGNEGHVKY